jgi:hypothetical protein
MTETSRVGLAGSRFTDRRASSSTGRPKNSATRLPMQGRCSRPGGACAGQGATCTLTIQAATSTNAVFELPTAAGGSNGGSTETALGTNTSGTAGTTTSGKVDKTVTAKVVRTRGSKSPRGKRIVQLELNLEENVVATFTLLRGKKTLLTKQLTTIRPGNRLLTLRIPKGVGKGKATLVFKLKDPAGNTFSGRRSIKIAAL